MTALLIKLLIAHVLGDFVLQPDRWVERKKKKKHRSIHFYLHGLVHLVSLLILLEFKLSYWLSIVIIVMSHLVIDLIKLNLDKRINPRLLFAADQLLHLLIIALVVYIYYPFTLDFGLLYSKKILLIILSLLVLTYVSSVLIKIIMSSWVFKEKNPEESLKYAGKYIGMLERLFVFVFIVINQWSAIGWLIAAKSVFRFSDLSRAKDRKLTEYILIGTLLSFGLAIAIGLLNKFLRIYL
jgi:hypothetical protein